MIRYFFTLRGFVITVLVASALFYVVAHPTAAGNNVAALFHTVIGWGESVISAVITFFHGVAG
jgi:hypothetical protein